MTNDGRNIPVNELDLQYMTIETTWGKEVTAELNNLLVDAEIINPGDPIEKKHLYGLLSFYTRDLRLANISVINGEFEFCRYHLSLAGDCLDDNYIKAFIMSLRRVIDVTELSQSKNGFLRRRQGTITKEEYSNSLDPKKRGLFGQKKDNQGGY